jgi:hypothetical protein
MVYALPCEEEASPTVMVAVEYRKMALVYCNIAYDMLHIYAMGDGKSHVVRVIMVITSRSCTAVTVLVTYAAVACRLC